MTTDPHSEARQLHQNDCPYCKGTGIVIKEQYTEYIFRITVETPCDCVQTAQNQQDK